MSRKHAPHFKVHVSFARHPKTIRVYEDHVMLAAYVRLGVAMIRHFADRTDDQMVVSGMELAEIAGTEQVSGAVQRMRKLASISPVEFLDPREPRDVAGVRPGCRPVVAELSTRGGTRRRPVWVLGLPNFAEKQGFGPRKSKDRGPSASASATATATVEEKTSSTERRRSAPTPPSPEAIDFAERFRTALKARTPDAKLPTERAFERWCAEADRMFRIDERTPKDAADLAGWLFNDTGDDAAFWRGNVRAVPKFRTKFEELREHRARASRKKEKTDDPGSNLAAAVRDVARSRGLVAGGDSEEAPNVRGHARRLPGGEEPGT